MEWEKYCGHEWSNNWSTLPGEWLSRKWKISRTHHQDCKYSQWMRIETTYISLKKPFCCFVAKLRFFQLFRGGKRFCLFAANYVDSSYISLKTTFFLFLLLNYTLFSFIAPKTFFCACLLLLRCFLAFLHWTWLFGLFASNHIDSVWIGLIFEGWVNVTSCLVKVWVQVSSRSMWCVLGQDT